MFIDFDRHFCISVDAQGYGERDDVRQSALQDGLLTVLTEAAEAAHLHRGRWLKQPTGDGELALLPTINPEPEPRLIDDYVHELDAALTRYNEAQDLDRTLRLRVAMHFGVAFPARNGYSGQAVVVVRRLLDAAPLRRALDAAPSANLALILSDLVYQDTVRQGHTSLRPDEFRCVSAQVKTFIAPAWVRVPGADAHSLDLGPVNPNPAQRLQPLDRGPHGHGSTCGPQWTPAADLGESGFPARIDSVGRRRNTAGQDA